MPDSGLSTGQERSRSTRGSQDRKAQTATKIPDKVTCQPGSLEASIKGRQVTAHTTMLNTAITRKNVHQVQTFFESLTPVRPPANAHSWRSGAACPVTED